MLNILVIFIARPGAAQPALTIYNQHFAVVRQTVPLNLQQGRNHVQLSDTTSMLEPDSVVLRDPSGQRALQIREQNYRSDLLNQGMMLSLYEGKTINFLVRREDREETVQGKIIRSGYVPPRGDPSYNYSNYGYGPPGPGTPQPIIEIDGRLHFSLPGIPLFPSLPGDTILKPSLSWLLETDKAGPLNAELAYITGGMSWEANYNIVAPENGDILEMLGWVTFDNRSGKTFENARVKLIAGDISKIQPRQRILLKVGEDLGYHGIIEGYPNGTAVTEKTFDEYHLYTLHRPVTLRDRETKQVGFVHADGIKSQRIYVYDGLKIDTDRYNYSYNDFRREREYGTQSNSKVWVMREFKNTKDNHLAIPLPKGRVRFYRRDTGGQLEFTGENTIDHTPQGETLRVYTGNAFDLVGERRQTNYKINEGNSKWLDEAFEIKLRNRKREPVEVRIVEHLYRSSNWKLTTHSNTFLKTDSRTIEFRVQVKPGEEKTVTYTVHYTW